MATKAEIEAAVKIVADFAGNPESGIVAEVLRDLLKSTDVDTIKKNSVTKPEERVIEIKETR